MSFKNKPALNEYLSRIENLHRPVYNTKKVGSYDLITNSSGGLRYDRILEFRVHIKEKNIKVYTYCFESLSQMIGWLRNMTWGDTERVDICMLVEQDTCYEFLDKANPNEIISDKTINIAGFDFVLTRKKQSRITEWLIEWESS